MTQATTSSHARPLAIAQVTRLLALLAILGLTACDPIDDPGSAGKSTPANSNSKTPGDAGDDSQNADAVIYEANDASMLDEPGGVSDAKAFFSYSDARGGAHIVQGLHNVPAAYQLKARNLSNGATRSINVYNAAATVRRAPSQEKGSSSFAAFNRNSLDVTVYSAEWCGACKRARQYLDSEGVDYVLRDIDDDPAAKDQVRLVLGKVRIPLIDINGTYVTGYDQKMIKRLIAGG